MCKLMKISDDVYKLEEIQTLVETCGHGLNQVLQECQLIQNLP